MIGRLSELAAPRRLSEEDRYAAKVAQDYVDFIRDQPWYEYDFATKLAGLGRKRPSSVRISCASGSGNTR